MFCIYPNYSDRQVWAITIDTDQTSPKVWSGCKLFAFPSQHFRPSLDSQMDLSIFIRISMVIDLEKRGYPINFISFLLWVLIWSVWRGISDEYAKQVFIKEQGK